MLTHMTQAKQRRTEIGTGLEDVILRENTAPLNRNERAVRREPRDRDRIRCAIIADVESLGRGLGQPALIDVSMPVAVWS